MNAVFTLIVVRITIFSVPSWTAILLESALLLKSFIIYQSKTDIRIVPKILAEKRTFQKHHKKYPKITQITYRLNYPIYYITHLYPPSLT